MVARPAAEVVIELDAGPAERALEAVSQTTNRTTRGIGNAFVKVGNDWDRTVSKIEKGNARAQKSWIQSYKEFSRRTSSTFAAAEILVARFVATLNRFLRLDANMTKRLDGLASNFEDLGREIARVVGNSTQVSTGFDALGTAINNLAVTISNKSGAITRFLDNYVKVALTLSRIGALGNIGNFIAQGSSLVNALAEGGKDLGPNTFVGPPLPPGYKPPKQVKSKAPTTITIDPITLTRDDARRAQQEQDDQTFSSIQNAFVTGDLEGPISLAKETDGQLKTIEDSISVSIDKIGAKYQELASQTLAFGQAWGKIWENIASNIGQVVGDLFAQMFKDLFQGKNALQTIGEFIGGVITNLGTMLISMGTAAVVSGALSTAVPALAGLGGGPGGVAAGAAAVAAGVALVATGAAIGSAVSAPFNKTTENIPTSSGSTSAARSANRNSAGIDSIPGSGGGSREVVVNVNFNRPIDARRAARELSDLFKEHGALAPMGG